MKQLNLVISILLFSVFSFKCQAQIIEAQLSTSDDQALKSGYATFEYESEIVDYLVIIKPSFTYDFKQKYEYVTIKIYTDDYKTHIQRVNLSDSIKTYNIKVQLVEKSVQSLDEVIIQGSKKFEIKKDTTSYNVDAYKNAEDKKVEDVLKNLPGINVSDETGLITYKGRQIKTVMLNGDNLFDRNYTIATKNINLDLIDKIEAIENYNENEIIGKLTRTDDVALNLKIKKGKIDFSGNIENATGAFNDGNIASGINGTAIGVAEKHKYFSTLIFNNIGIKNTPSNLNKSSKSKKIIAENFSKANLNSDYSNINEEFFGSLNSIFKLNKKVDLKAKIYFSRDNLNSKQIVSKKYFINEDEFRTIDETNFQKKTQLISANLSFKKTKSEKSIFKMDFNFTGNKIDNSINIKQNNERETNSYLNTDEIYISPKLNYTHKLSDKKALQIETYYNFNQAPQEIFFSPNLEIADKRIESQYSKFKNHKIGFKSDLISKTSRNKNDYNISVGYILNKLEYKSYQKSTGTNENSSNDLDFNKADLFAKARYNINYKSLKINSEIKLTYLNQDLSDDKLNQGFTTDDYILEPKINLRYNFKNSFINLSSSYSEKAILDDYLFTNQVLLDNRNLIQNSPSQRLQKTKSLSLLYFKNDLYNNLDIGFFGNYQEKKGNYFANSTISENYIQTKYFYAPQENKTLNLGFNFSKYIDILASTIKLNSSYNFSEFHSIINGSNFRTNQNQFLEQTLFFKTAFLSRLNFENEFTWQKSIGSSDNNLNFENNSLTNNFKIIYKPIDNWLLISSYDIFIPDLSDQNQNFNFVDINLNYTPNNKNWSLSLMGRNLTNESTFTKVYTTDISTDIISNNLLSRHFLIGFTWGF